MVMGSMKQTFILIYLGLFDNSTEVLFGRKSMQNVAIKGTEKRNLEYLKKGKI